MNLSPFFTPTAAGLFASLVLVMMSSHFLNQSGTKRYRMRTTHREVMRQYYAMRSDRQYWSGAAGVLIGVTCGVLSFMNGWLGFGICMLTTPTLYTTAKYRHEWSTFPAVLRHWLSEGKSSLFRHPVP